MSIQLAIETKRALRSGNGTCTATSVSRICSRRAGRKKFSASGQKEQQTHSDARKENAEPFQRMQDR
jgi:hypothetical protein